MLERFMKKFTNPALAEQEKEVINMTTETEATAQAAATIAELTASLEQANAALAEKTTAFAELTSKVEQMTATLAAIESEKAEAAAVAKAAVMQNRKEKLEAVLGTAHASAVLATLENSDDTTFNTVLSAFSLNREEESKSKMFTEEGVSAEVPVPKEEADTATRLAAMVAAQYPTEGNK